MKQWKRPPRSIDLGTTHHHKPQRLIKLSSRRVLFVHIDPQRPLQLPRLRDQGATATPSQMCRVDENGLQLVLGQSHKPDRLARVRREHPQFELWQRVVAYQGQQQLNIVFGQECMRRSHRPQPNLQQPPVFVGGCFPDLHQQIPVSTSHERGAIVATCSAWCRAPPQSSCPTMSSYHVADDITRLGLAAQEGATGSRHAHRLDKSQHAPDT